MLTTSKQTTVFLFLLLVSLGAATRCPPEDLISPCWCQKVLIPTEIGPNKMVRIICGGNSTIDIKSVFSRLNKNMSIEHRYFDELLINNTAITELPKNILGSVVFDRIELIRPLSLRKIHSRAFNKTAHLVKEFYGVFTLNLTNHPSPYDVFDMLNSFTNAKSITFWAPNVTAIPASAFRNEDLKALSLGLANTTLTVGSKAFTSLESISVIDLTLANIANLSENALLIESDKNNETNSMIQINLGKNNLTSESFHQDALINIKRPASINFFRNNITYLDEKVFKRFLDGHKQNRIQSLQWNPLNCTDCRNSWLGAGRDKYRYRVFAAFCGGQFGKSVFDADWKKCK